MLYVSEIQRTALKEFKSTLQKTAERERCLSENVDTVLKL